MATVRSARSGSQADVWRSLFRIGVGVYWLYFASQKWPAPLGVGPTHGIGWIDRHRNIGSPPEH